MPRKSDDFINDFIGQVGILLDVRSKTLEINLKAHVSDEIKASEKRIRKDMATKEDIKNMATKQDIERLEIKVDKALRIQEQLDELKERIKILEKTIRIHN